MGLSGHVSGMGRMVYIFICKLWSECLKGEDQSECLGVYWGENVRMDRREIVKYIHLPQDMDQ
jgi:hypothetical protein